MPEKIDKMQKINHILFEWVIEKLWQIDKYKLVNHVLKISLQFDLPWIWGMWSIFDKSIKFIKAAVSNQQCPILFPFTIDNSPELMN